MNSNFLKTIPANVEGRDFVVGDIHGCFDELTRLLNHVKFDPDNDRVFCTGDLIDRGPKSAESLSLLNKKWFYSCFGNHEDLMISKLKMMEHGQTQALTPEEMAYFKGLSKYVPQIMKMPLIQEVEHLLLGKFYVIHGEILPEHLYPFTEEQIGSKEYERYFNTMKKYDFSQQIQKFFTENKDKTLDHSLRQKLLWSRKIVSAFYRDHKNAIDQGSFSFMKEDSFEQKIKIFCGHNVVPFPMKIGQQYYIDTGSALGYSSKEVNSNLFSQFGHEFFTLSMVDVTTGFCYGCISSAFGRGKVMRLEKSLYE